MTNKTNKIMNIINDEIVTDATNTMNNLKMKKWEKDYENFKF